MTRVPVYLSAPRYVLGEIEADHATLPDLAEKAAQYGLAMLPDLWGWGTYRRTTRTTDQLAVAAGAQTLEAAGIEPSVVDALIVCSTQFPGGAQSHGTFVGTVMDGLGLPHAAFTGLTLNRCTGLLAGIDVAEAMVASGRHRTVLVASTDRIADETERLTTFALFSDGAASCLVAADGYGDATYEVIACATAQDNRSLDWANEISSDLARAVNEAVLKPAGSTVEDVDGLMHPNLFIPLVVMKEQQAGFAKRQLYTDNVKRTGHCFAADPLINLVDRAAAGQVHPGRLYLLAASVPGSRHGVLLRRTP